MMTTLEKAGNAGDVVRLRMTGRDDVAVWVRGEAPPAVIAGTGLAAYAVRVTTAATPYREVTLPFEAEVAGSGARRLASYVVGRYCAARALAAAGRHAESVPIGGAGAPAWPAGLVGSISHTEARALAVVGASSRWRGVGVDCERVLGAAAAGEIVGHVLPEADAVEIAGERAVTWEEFVTVGFSAKETLYKCLRPIVGQFFDFPDAELTRVDRDTQRVRVRLVNDLAPGFLRGRTFDVGYAIADAHVFTCLALPATAGLTAPESDR